MEPNFGVEQSVVLTIEASNRYEFEAFLYPMKMASYIFHAWKKKTLDIIEGMCRLVAGDGIFNTAY